MKTRFVVLCSITLAAFATGCSGDSPAGIDPVATNLPIVTPAGTLDDNVSAGFGLYSGSTATEAAERWNTIKNQYDAGLTDAAQMRAAKRSLFEFASWLTERSVDLRTNDGESKSAAIARVILYASLYVYSGPGTTPPHYSPRGDAVAGLVVPNRTASIVTPLRRAGVSLPAGAVGENTIVVVSQNVSAFSSSCSGPLPTLLCQYPQFYNFMQFPQQTLLKDATFAVCHHNVDKTQPTTVANRNFRLAHPKPDDPGALIPGGSVRDANGERIEILPGASQSLIACGNFEHASAGKARHFGAFNEVDLDGRPDRAVQSLSAAPLCASAGCTATLGSRMRVKYAIANVGTAATGDGVPGVIMLVKPRREGTGLSKLVGSFYVGQIAPGQSMSFDREVTIPASLPPGTYSVVVTVGAGFFNELPGALGNNSDAVPLSITVANK